LGHIPEGGASTSFSVGNSGLMPPLLAEIFLFGKQKVLRINLGFGSGVRIGSALYFPLNPDPRSDPEGLERAKRKEKLIQDR
jgi:hypothetical protein